MSKAYYVKVTGSSSMAVDGFRNKEQLPGAPWSKIVFKPVGEVDPYIRLSAAERTVERCAELGVEAVVVGVDVGDPLDFDTYGNSN